MSVSNGQAANATNFNNAFMSRTTDDNTTGKKDLQNTDPASGANVINVQREINSNNAFTGRPSGSAHDATPVWTNNDVGTNSDDLHDRAEALTAKFNGTTGHGHTGGTGDGPMLDDTGITAPYRGYVEQGTNLTGVTGGTHDVSTELTTKAPSTSSTVLGVPSTAPYNKVFIRNTTSMDPVEDGSGNQVYGRLTNSGGLGGTWTLTFYSDVSGVETAYSFSGSNNISWWYQELFHPLNPSRPVYDESFFVPSDNATQDVIDASATQSGKVNTGAQTFAGTKTFNSSPILNSLTASLPLKLDGLKQIISQAIDLATAEVTGILTTLKGGTGLGAYTLGDILYSSATNVLSALAGNTTTTRKFLRQTGTGVASAAPVWDTIVAGDLPVASAVADGIVNQVAQSFAGEKNFVDGFAADSQDIASAATITALSSTKSFVRLTGVTATQLQGITAPASGKSKRLVFYNFSTQTTTVKNENAGASAANRIITPSGGDLSVSALASVEFQYDTVQSRWIVISSGGGSGGGQYVVLNSEGAPANVVAGTGIVTTGGGIRTMAFIQGSGGAVDVTANPQIPAGAAVGYELLLIGRSDDNTVGLHDGDGLSLNGSIYLGANDVLKLIWSGTVWLEQSRSM